MPSCPGTITLVPRMDLLASLLPVDMAECLTCQLSRRRHRCPSSSLSLSSSPVHVHQSSDSSRLLLGRRRVGRIERCERYTHSVSVSQCLARCLPQRYVTEGQSRAELRARRAKGRTNETNRTKKCAANFSGTARRRSARSVLLPRLPRLPSAGAALFLSLETPICDLIRDLEPRGVAREASLRPRRPPR